MAEVWIVEGATGEYSDHREWIVCGFFDEQKAKDLAEQLGALMRDALQKAQDLDLDYDFSVDVGLGDPWCQTDEGKKLLALDPNAKNDYSGTNYTAFKVEVRE